jgi:hypothetical protein
LVNHLPPLKETIQKVKFPLEPGSIAHDGNNPTNKIARFEFIDKLSKEEE